MMDTILPCPFCGKPPEIEDCEDGSIWASCSDSGMKCPAYGNGAELAAWNRRPQPSAPVQPEQEPAAWLCKHGSRPHVYLPGEMTLAQSNDGLDIPLYASPSAQPKPEEAARDESDCKCPACVPGQDLPGLLRALSDQKQCDEDGVMCEVSRQAVDEAIAIIRQHLKSAPEPSVAAEAIEWAKDAAREIYWGSDWLHMTSNGYPPDDSGPGLNEMVSVILKHLPAHPGIVPGWVMVPVDPTPDMTNAGRLTLKGAVDMYERVQAECCYRSMVAAAPKGRP